MKENKWDFLPDFSERLTENKIKQIVFNADLRNSHDGLFQIAKGLRINVDALRVGEFVVFVNTKKTALKIYAAGHTVAHFKMPGSSQMNLKVISLIPKFFNGKELKYDDALREVITEQIKAK